MFRNQFLPLEIVDLLPPMDGGSQDSPGIGIASDGRQYVLKVATKEKPLLPATEAFCASLATACQLPVAQGAWLNYQNGIACYGSRLEGGVVKSLADSPILRKTPLLQHAIKRRWQRCDNKSMASGHYALDLFLFNFDRHLTNFLFQEMGSRTEVLGIDYSRAWWTVSSTIAGLPPASDMPKLDKRIERTVRVGRIVRKWIGFDLQVACRTLQIMRQVPDKWVMNFCDEIPDQWITPAVVNEMVAWWKSPHRLARIDNIEQGLINGSLL